MNLHFDSVQPEGAVWCVLCWAVLIARLFSRRISLGAWKRLRPEDYLALLAMVSATILMVLLDKVEKGFAASSGDFSEEDEMLQVRIYTSKLLVATEQLQLVTLWLMKGTMLLMYWRLTLLMPQHTIVKFAAACVIGGFVIIEILYFAVWCRPFHDYWNPTEPKIQCMLATHHLITSFVVNVTTDLMIISIPLPLFKKCQLPLKKKLVLVGLFGLGVFTIVAAMISKIRSFLKPADLRFVIWYLREAFTAILCGNLPLLYPLLKFVFKRWNWSGSFFHRSRGESHHQRPSDSHIKLSDSTVGTELKSRNEEEGGIRRTVNVHRVSDEFEVPAPIKEDLFDTGLSTTTTIGTGPKEQEDLEAQNGPEVQVKGESSYVVAYDHRQH